MTNQKEGNTMKTKKIVAGTYKVNVGDSEFEIFQNDLLSDKGWELRIVTYFQGKVWERDWIETFPTLSSAKEYLKEYGHTYKNGEQVEGVA
jgi:hypothetical protein